MTHPQWSPETLVGSFGQQVFSLMVTVLWRGVNSSPGELQERPLLAAPQLGSGWGIPARGLRTFLPRGGNALGCLGATGGVSPGDLIAGLSRHSYRPPTETGALPQPRLRLALMEEPR